MPKVLIIGGSYAYYKMFEKRGWEYTTNLSNIFNVDLVQFTGGSDVTPEIYGEKNTHSQNHFPRDVHEAGVFALALRLGKPMAGICRGGQFLNVMCGGKMIQHVEGHANGHGHYIDYWGKPEQVYVSSTHHQMMIPDYDSAEVLAYADKVTEADPEVVLYPYNRCLCFQPHPEFDGYEECTDLYFNLLKLELDVG